MNKMLVTIFDNDTAADAGLQALRILHGAGDITLYAAGVMAEDEQGGFSVRKFMDPEPSGTLTGLAVGSLIGLLGGPVGVVAGAASGTVIGAVRDFWAAGVGLDFIEEAKKHLQPGKVALIAEVEEEWITPVDAALEAAGGHVFRRTRADLAEAQFDRDISAFRGEIKELEAEVSHAAGEANTKLQTKLAAAKAGLESAANRARQRVDQLKQEADAKAESLKSQLGQVKDDVKARIEDRVKRVRSGSHARGAKLLQAWGLAKEALSV